MSVNPSAGDLYYDPLDFQVDEKAQEIWKRLRDEAPLYWNEKYQFFALSRYDDILRAVVDTETFSSAHGTTLEMMGPEIDPMSESMMIFMDPPAHSWHRKVVSRAFTPRRLETLEERLVHLCNRLLDGLDGRTEFDFLEDYGAVIPPTVILSLLGFPDGHEEQWRRDVDAALSIEHRADAEESADQGAAASAEMGVSVLFQILPGLIEERRRHPEEDLISVLVHTDLDEDGRLRKLTDEEIFAFVMLISAAGTETVARLLGWAVSLLDEHPDERAKLVGDPSLIPNAIEECLRYEAPSPVNGRWTTKDTTFQGQLVPSGSRLLLLNGSGNRDERHFPDADRFDVTRRIDRHLSFGYGAHFCIGAALARMEGHVAIREFLRRHPEWQVDRATAEMVHTATVRGFAKIPIHV